MDNEVMPCENNNLIQIYTEVLRPFKIIFSKLLHRENYVCFSGLGKCLVLTSQLMSMVDSHSNELQEINLNSLSKSHISFLVKSIKILKSSLWSLLKSSDLKSENLSFHQNFAFIFESAIGILREIFEFYSKDYKRFIVEKQLLFEELHQHVFFHSKMFKEFLLQVDTAGLNLEDTSGLHNFDSTCTASNWSCTETGSVSNITTTKNNLHCDEVQYNSDTNTNCFNKTRHNNNANIRFGVGCFSCEEPCENSVVSLPKTSVGYAHKVGKTDWDATLNENILKCCCKQRQAVSSLMQPNIKICREEKKSNFISNELCSEPFNLPAELVDAKLKWLNINDKNSQSNGINIGNKIEGRNLDFLINDFNSQDSGLTEEDFVDELRCVKVASLSADQICKTNEESMEYEDNAIQCCNIPLNEAAPKLPVSMNLLQESFHSMFAALNEDQKQIVTIQMEKLSYQINYFSLVQRGKRNYFYCNLCEHILELERVQKHAAENKHLMKLAEQSRKSNSTAVVKNISKENLEYLDFITSSQMYMCTLCNVTLKNSSDSWIAHFQSVTHDSKLNKKEINDDLILNSVKDFEIRNKLCESEQITDLETSYNSQRDKRKPEGFFSNKKNVYQCKRKANFEFNSKFEKYSETSGNKENFKLNRNSLPERKEGNVKNGREIKSKFSCVKISSLCSEYFSLSKKEKECLQMNMKYMIFDELWINRVYCCACLTYLPIVVNNSSGQLTVSSFNSFFKHFYANRHKFNCEDLGPASDLIQNLKFIQFFEDAPPFCSLCNETLQNHDKQWRKIPRDFKFLLEHFEKSEKHRRRIFSKLKNHENILNNYFIIRD